MELTYSIECKTRAHGRCMSAQCQCWCHPSKPFGKPLINGYKRGRGALGFMALIASAGAMFVYTGFQHVRAIQGRNLCVASAGFTVAQVEQINLADGIAPGRPLSLDDYCGAQCRPGSIGWDACLAGCRDYCDADTREADEADER